MDGISEADESGQNNRVGARIDATLNYIADTAEKRLYFTFDPPPGTPRLPGEVAAHTVSIRDAREIVHELSLDRQGFQLVYQQTSVEDFYKKEEVKRVYYPEVEHLLKEATGAPKRSWFSIIRCAISS